ncbi:MAG: hypothetical protein FJX92_06665 [Bacteroidetes bacterium]|nr:hypothetical protein [Bacteroidota bacterium]
MKNTLLLLLLAGFSFSGCRTAFPEAQTPDDVYYSPEGAGNDYVRINTDEDRYLRMKVRDRRNWSDLNDWYTYERWTYGMNYSFGTPFHPFYTWNVFHNPYWGVGATGTRTPNRPRVSNLNTYQFPANNNPTLSGNPKFNPVRSTGSQQPNYNRPSTGGVLRDLFRNGNQGSSSPGSSSPSPSNNAPTQSAPVRKF